MVSTPLPAPYTGSIHASGVAASLRPDRLGCRLTSIELPVCVGMHVGAVWSRLFSNCVWEFTLQGADPLLGTGGCGGGGDWPLAVSRFLGSVTGQRPVWTSLTTLGMASWSDRAWLECFHGVCSGP